MKAIKDCYDRLLDYVKYVLQVEAYRKQYALGGKWDALRGASVRDVHGIDDTVAHAMQSAWNLLDIVPMLNASTGGRVEYSRGEYVLQRKVGRYWHDVASIPVPMVKGKVNMLQVYMYTMAGVGTVTHTHTTASRAPWLYKPTKSKDALVINGFRLATRKSGEHTGEAFVWEASFTQFSDTFILPHLMSAVAYCADAVRSGASVEYRIGYKPGLHVRLGYGATEAEALAKESLAQRRARELAEAKERLRRVKEDRKQLELERELRAVNAETDALMKS